MQTDLPIEPIREAERLQSIRLPLGWDFTPFFGLWVLACWGLVDHWRLNPQYHYGWFVPVLALFFAYERWNTRPGPGRPVSSAIWLVGGLGVFLPATWLFIQPNPDWPLANWILVTQIVAILLGTIGLAGGWKWVGYFAFPVMLIFTAVPWPDQVETPLMQFLMRAVARTAVVALDLIGVTALQHGNLLEVTGGVVGVDEACSGIRSLQGSLASAIFLGELFRFTSARRIILVGVSIAIAFAMNVIRVGFLAWSAAKKGINSVNQWHDPAGMTVLFLCVAALFLIALLFDRNTSALRTRASNVHANPLPRWLAPIVAGWLGLTVLAAEVWYYDGAEPPKNPWAFKPPSTSATVAIPPSAWNQLRFDEATGAKWTQENGLRWMMYFFDWEFGPTFSRVAARMHRPDICLPATGRELQSDRGLMPFSVQGHVLPFHAYVFREGAETLYVYHGVWSFRSHRASSQGPLSEGKQLASIQSVLWRERRMGQQAAEFAVWGCADGAEADAAFSALLPKVLSHRQSPVLPLNP